MKWKNSEHLSGEDQTEDEAPYQDEDDSPWALKKRKKPMMALGSNRAMIYAVLAVGVVVLLGGVVFPQLKVSAQKARVEALEARIIMLEKRIDRYESIDEKVTRIWEQAKAFEKFKERFDRSESSMSLRMDHLAMSLDSLQKKTDAAVKKIDKYRSNSVQVKKQKPKKVTEKSKTVFHTVKPGETLYSISKTYHIEMKDLLNKNNLRPNAVIHVGQKLTIH